MPAMENASVAGTVAVVGLGTTLFTAFMPKMAELRIENVSTENSTQVRHAEIMGTITLLAFAGIVSYWAHTPVPLLSGVVTCVAMSAAYEISLYQGSMSHD